MRDHSRDYYDDKYIDGRYPAVKAPAQELWDDEFWDDDDDEVSQPGYTVRYTGDDRDADWERDHSGYVPESDDRYEGAADESSWEMNHYLRSLPARQTTRRSVRSREEIPEFEEDARQWRNDPQAVVREQERLAQEAVQTDGPSMPLTIVIIVTAILLTVLAGVGRFRGYRDVDWNWKRMPLLSVVFRGLHNDITPIAALAQSPETEETIENAAAVDSAMAATEDGSVDAAEETDATEVDLHIPDGVNEEVVQATDYGVCDSYYLAPEGTVFERQTTGIYAPNGTYLMPQRVDARYFADALLIGDSRTDGLHLYSGMADDAHFWCREALTVYDIFDETAVYYPPGDMDGEEMSLEEVLGASTFRKVYVCIGINEVGTANTMQFYQQYMELLSYIRERQPDALIYIQGMMHVSASYSQTNAALNNTNVVEKNTAIASLANGRDIFYLDMNSAVCDENGDLLDSLSNDGLHLKASAYQLWKEDLLGHAFVRDDADWTAPETAADGDAGDSDAGAAGQGTGKPESDISAETGRIVQ